MLYIYNRPDYEEKEAKKNVVTPVTLSHFVSNFSCLFRNSILRVPYLCKFFIYIYNNKGNVNKFDVKSEIRVTK